MPRRISTKRVKPSFSEQAMGVQGKTTAAAADAFANLLARTGYGSPNLGEGAEYPLLRSTLNYWTLCSMYEGSWIFRKIVDIPATDMCRAWPKLTSDIEPKLLTKIDRAVRKANVKGNLLSAMKWGRLFGGAGALIVIDGHEKELDTPLDLDSIPIHGFKGVIPFDRWQGIYPNNEYCRDINRPVDFNLPESYRVSATGGQSFDVHASRILRFTGYEQPSPEREVYNMWGSSVLEPVIQEVSKRDNASWSILNLIFRANILGLKFPELAQVLSGLGGTQQANARLQTALTELNHMISNQSLVPIPKDGGLESTQYSFSGLGEVYQQFCLDVSGAAEIPVARMWGKTITGLGSAGDQDEKIYEEKIATDQDTYMRPQLEKLFPVICASELGEVPDDLDLIFPSIRVLDETEKAGLAKTIVDGITVCINTGIMSPRTGGKELKQSSDQTGFGTNLTDEDIEKLSDKVQGEGELGAGLFEGGEGGLNPADGPAKAIKETDREAQGESDAPEPVDKPQQAAPNAPRGAVAPQKTAVAQDEDGRGPERDIHGLRVVIETPKGYSRHGKDENGKPWKTVMPAHYGYLKGHDGADGDSLDMYLGPDASSQWVYVIDQSALGNRRKYDEAKCMLGFSSQTAALAAYDAGHHRAKDIMLDFTPMTVQDFKAWLKDRDPRKPCSTEVTAR
jgi:hypothetical protein